MSSNRATYVTLSGRIKTLNHKPALLMSVREREQMDELRATDVLHAARDLTYSQFTYKVKPRPIPALERAWDREPCEPNYWANKYKVDHNVPRFKTHAQASVLQGTRFEEWHALRRIGVVA